MIGEGAYPIAEAARYAGVPVATVRSWFKPRADGRGRGPLFHSDLPAVGDDYAISFLNLVEVYVARFFRNEGVRPERMRRAHEILQVELGNAHPFAHADLGTDGKQIILATAEGDLRDVISRQHFFKQMKLRRFTFNQTTRLAEQWRIGEGVLINPRVSFGKPVAEGSGVTTYVLANQFYANGEDADVVAELYEVAAADVRRAVVFEAAHRRRAA